MSAKLPLRTRVLLGAVLWTIGLFLLTAVVHTAVMLRHPSLPRILQTLFAHPAHAAETVTVAVVCMLAGLWQVRKGLLPFDQLRARLASVRRGDGRRLHGSYPAEVQPLVDDLNALLEHRERMVHRAQAKAADLAHGLKTPLALLAQEAERAQNSGCDELAEVIAQQVDRMRRQIDYHLAHARAAASGAVSGARCNVNESAQALARALLRLYAERGIAIEITVPPDHAVRVQREDLDEMLGNLLDNACKWAQSRVHLVSSSINGSVVVAIDDDGPGVAVEMREHVLRRGVRADEAAPGFGFGLAIVRDLAELYGGAISLDRAEIGGLRAQLRLPAASETQ